MKTSSLFTVLAIAASAPLLFAAPAVSVNDLSPATLKGVATPSQLKSIQANEKATTDAAATREKEIAEAKRITDVNDKGMKKTIQKRTLNNMLPACEREPEAPRNPGIYEVR